jgi:plastocyanin
MGLQVVYMADADVAGKDPYRQKVNDRGVINHGQLEENSDHGGTGPVVGPDPRTLPSGLLATSPLSIGGYTYEAGDFRIPGAIGRPPVVEQGEQITFQLSSSDEANRIWHSLTSCKSPCNKSTGISYPIPDGEFQFDSGQLGSGGAPTVNRTTWSTPPNMPVGTHTFFCRIHPLMRGAVRVIKPR